MKYLLLLSLFLSCSQEWLTAQQTVRLPFRTDASNLLYVDVSINGRSSPDFIFDTGASGVVINAELLSDLLADGTLEATDFGPKQQVMVANGSRQEVYLVNARELSIGGHVLYDVAMAVMPTEDAPLLVGQNVFKQFGQVSIDYQKEEILLSKGSGSGSTASSNPAAAPSRVFRAAELRIIPCSKQKEAEVEPLKAMILRDARFDIDHISIETNVPPPAAAIQRIDYNYTVRYFASDTKAIAEALRSFVELDYCPQHRISNTNQGTEDMRPSYNNREIPDYVEIWLR